MLCRVCGLKGRLGQGILARLEDNDMLIASLKDVVAAKSYEAGQIAGIIQSKNAEIGLLEARVMSRRQLLS